jgi:hypothetical protein
LRYFVCRSVAILKDPKAAYPPTEKHAEARELLKSVAGGNANEVATSTEEEANMDLDVFVEKRVRFCEPKGMEAHNSELDVTERRKEFQRKAPRCFCRKKTAKDACQLNVYDLAKSLKREQTSAYAFFVKRPDHVGKLTEALQCRLGLDVTAIPRAFNVPRGTIFGFVLDKNATVGAAASTSDTAHQAETPAFDPDGVVAEHGDSLVEGTAREVSSMDASARQQSDKGMTSKGSRKQSNATAGQTDSGSSKTKDEERDSDDESSMSSDSDEPDYSDADEESSEESGDESDSDEDSSATSSDADSSAAASSDDDANDARKRKKSCNGKKPKPTAPKQTKSCTGNKPAPLKRQKSV